MYKYKALTLSFLGILMFSITGCGTPDGTPGPQKLNRNILAVPSSTTLGVTSLTSYSLPEDGQIVEQSGLFKSIDDVYDGADNRILIPSGATINGIYMNDGTNCKILWKSVYAYNDVTGDEINAVPLSLVTKPTLCNPHKVIKLGERITINFTDLKN